MSKRGSDQFKRPEIPMRFEDFSFGSIRIDGTTYEHDVVIDPSSAQIFSCYFFFWRATSFFGTFPARNVKV